MADRLTLKFAARRRIAWAKPSPYLVTMALVLIQIVVQVINGKLDLHITDWAQYLYLQFFTKYAAVSAEEAQAFQQAWANSGLTVVRPVYESTVWVALLLMVALVLLMRCVRLGYDSYALKLSRGEPAGLRDLSDGFPFVLKAVALFVIQTVIILLLSCLLIIPGVIAFYKYRMSWFLLLDNPDWGPIKCIIESRRIMRGRKAELFMLDLSFLGWYALCWLTGGLLFVWRQPHFSVTYALFYGELIGRSCWDFEDPAPRS